jgi:TolB-like protein
MVSGGSPDDIPTIELANYRFLSKLGQGGMGSVYLAEQQNPKRKVAIKIVAPDDQTPPAFLEAMKQEGDIAAQFEHDNLAHVYECGIVDDHYYLAMQYLAKGDLEQRLRQGVTLDEVRTVVRAIASALQHIHQKGYIHRDIKPANILFSEADKPVLADFGVAKSADSVGVLTSAGYTTGTPAYMSPEQIRGKDLDGRADLYSLGVVLYECLTGELPLWSDNEYEMKRLQVEQPAPRLTGALKSFQPILDRLLAKHPEQRYADAAQLISDLDSMGKISGMATQRLPSGATTAPMAESTPSPVTVWVREMGKRRVFRALALYVALGWGLTEIVTGVADKIAAIPDWVATGVTSAFVVGLPLVVALTWLYDWGPDGIRRTPSRRTGLLVSSVGLAATIAIAWFLYFGSQNDIQSTADPSPVAVAPILALLPLANLSPDAKLDYMGRSIAEELLNDLSGVSGLRIKGTASSFTLADSSPPEIASALGINRLVTGSFQLTGESIRIRVQLLDAASDEVIWSQVYNDALTNIYTLQATIAGAVAAGMGLDLPGARPSRMVNPEAYRLYLEARQGYVNPFADGPATRERMLAVLEIDPDYPQALSFLGYLEIGTAWVMEDRASPILAIGKERLLRSLDLDPEQPEAYASLALAYALQYQWLDARNMADRAVQKAANRPLGPIFEFPYNNLAHTSKSVAIALRRFDLEPLDPEALRHLLWAYEKTEDDEKLLQVAAMLEERGIPYQSRNLALAYARGGDQARAIKAMTPAFKRMGLPDGLQPNVINALLNWEDQELADYLVANRDQLGLPLANFIWLSMAAGVDADLIFDLAEQAWRNRKLNPIAFYDAGATRYRAHPRFIPLMEEMGLADYWRSVEAPDFCAVDLVEGICP